MAVSKFSLMHKVHLVLNFCLGAICLSNLHYQIESALAATPANSAEGGHVCDSEDRAAKFQELYNKAGMEMENLNIEKARKLYQEIDRLSGHDRFGARARVVLKAEMPLYPVSSECNDMYKQGSVLMRSPNPGDALNLFSDLARRYPKFEWAQTAMASVYMRLKDTEAAAQCARHALTINENFLQAWMILIHDSVMHNDLDGEIDAVTRAHQLDPANPMINGLLSRVLHEKNSQKPD